MRYYLLKISINDLLGNVYYQLLKIKNNISDEKLENIFSEIIQGYPDNADFQEHEEIPKQDYDILRKYLPEYEQD